MTVALLLLGFLMLIKGADFFVEGASGIAQKFKVPSILIGLTIVAFGTSSPEAAVSIQAALNGSNGIALGNVLGSNLFNISVILGITALICPLTVERQTVRKEIPLTLLAGLALFALSLDQQLSGAATNTLSRGDGFILLLFFSIFMYYVIEVALSSHENFDTLDTPAPKSLNRNLLYTLGGLAGVIIGGELVVRSSTTIARSLGISETVIGLTIIAIGTSLPELVTSIVAARKKQTDIAVGNIVGSNLFNIFLVLGTSAAINPIAFDNALITELALNLGLTLTLLIFARTQYTITRKEGTALCAVYGGYFVWLMGDKVF